MTSLSPPARNRRGQGGRLRESLLQSAAKLLDEGASIDTLSLRSIARDSGVKAPSVYLHFSGKDDLIGALLRNLFEQLGKQIAEAIAAEPDPSQELRLRCRAYCRFALDHPGKYRIMFSEQLPPRAAEGDSPLPGAAVFTDLRDALARAPRSDGPPPEVAATLLWGAMHGMVTLRATRPLFPWPPLADHLDQILATVGYDVPANPARTRPS